MGIDPSREAADLHQRPLPGEPVGDTTGGPDETPASRAPPFVGRDQQLARLAGLDAGQRVALVCGHAGSGKLRLLEEVAVRADGAVLRARAVLPEREAPWTLDRVLLRAAIDAGADPETLLPVHSRAALAPLLPELADDTAPDRLDAKSRRALALDGAARRSRHWGRRW